MAEARRRRAVLGAQGLAALWITSSEILGPNTAGCCGWGRCSWRFTAGSVA